MKTVINFPITDNHIHMLATSKERFNALVRKDLFYDRQPANKRFNVKDVVIYPAYDEDMLFEIMDMVKDKDDAGKNIILYLRRMTPFEKKV